MDPVTILAATNAALNLIATLTPQIQAMVQSGKITVAQQQALSDAIAKIEATGFTGPEWAVSK